MRSTILLFLLTIASVTARAQGVRVSGVTSLQAVDLRPLVDDSVPASQASGSGPYRTLADGQVVRCVQGAAYCYFRSSGDRALAAPFVQDLSAIAWGLGQGISAFTHLRFRGSFGSNTLTWPRADDAFDAIEAWVEIDRAWGRGRLGRQWVSSGLGVYNYDGASLALRRDRARLEVFGGRSLVAGLNEPLTGPALADLNDLPPDDDGWLIGLAGLTPLGTRGNVGATWQRVIRGDHAALYSDRLGADVSWRAFGGSADFALAWDITELQVNEAHLQLARPFAKGISASVEARRYRPFFESWTIWGAFSPVAFDELRGEIDWRSPRGSLSVEARGAWRSTRKPTLASNPRPLKTKVGARAPASSGRRANPGSRMPITMSTSALARRGATSSEVCGGCLTSRTGSG